MTTNFTFFVDRKEVPWKKSHAGPKQCLAVKKVIDKETSLEIVEICYAFNLTEATFIAGNYNKSFGMDLNGNKKLLRKMGHLILWPELSN